MTTAHTNGETMLKRRVGSDELPTEPGRYVLYVSHSCPFAHRAILARRLMGLEDAIPMVEMAPTLPASGIGWHFDATYPDPVNGWNRLKEAYDATFGGDYDGHVSEPLLWDTQTRTIVSNESMDILRMVCEAFEPWARNAVDLRPEAFCDENDALSRYIATSFAGRFYDAHFRSDALTKQTMMDEVYDAADGLEQRLETRRYLFGDGLCEADLILFPALTRFEAVYTPLFGFERKTLADYPNLTGYMRDMAQTFDLDDTVRFQINADSYYLSPGLNPQGVTPPQGPLPDLESPHGRGA